MKILRPTIVLTTILTLAVGALVALPAAADRPLVAGKDRVVPVGDTVFGKSYADWSIAWWRWIFVTSADASPFADSGPVDCAFGQPDPRVLFLTGPFSVTGTVERTCEEAISSSTYIFLPILNVECSDVEAPPFFGATPDDRLDCVNAFEFTDLQASFNRRAFTDLDGFVVTSADFTFTATDGNRGGVPEGPGNSTSRGAWLMLRPFPPGEYVIRFTGTIPLGGGASFTAKATYHITVQ